jgi:biotin carboxyl carrier protein
MELEVTLDGRKRLVRVTPRREGGYLVALDDGPATIVSAQDLGGGDLALRIGGQRTVVGVHVATDTVAVQVRGRGFVGTAVDARSAALRLGGGASAGLVATQMPGVVVRLLVAEGDTVQAGAPVVVVEAMKMENELKAPISGVVRAVHAQAGQAVESGAPLLVIESEA